MCGRFAFYSPTEATAALFGAPGSLEFEPRYNIAPTQPIAAVRNAQDNGRELVSLRWGLVPFWAKDPSIGNRMINARAETVAEKPSFRAAYRKRRCLVLADGFYEWKKEAGGKTPYLITLASGEPFAFAGLWEHWTSKETGEVIESGTLLTTEANEFMRQLHDRMPVIVEPDAADTWLAGADDAIDALTANTPPLKAWPVARRVNSPANEGQELIEPVGETLAS